jgi:thiol-disulfide isomerase/thioredoxin
MTTLQTAIVLAVLGGTPDGIVLEFSSQNCGPCRAMAPIVHRLQQQGYAIRTVDIDRERELARRFRIDRVPTTVLLIGGRERQRYVGRLDEAQLRRMARSIPTRSEPVNPKVQLATHTQPSRLPPSSQPRPPGSFTPSGLTVPSVIRANIGDRSQPIISSDPLTVCARIRVRDSRGLDIGSGTIIDSQPGRTVILTCGHVFRHFDDKGRIEVDVFHAGQPRSFEGHLIDHDLKADVGLISISTLRPLPVARICAQPARPGQHVFSVGCGGGDPPTRLQHLVTTTTRYQAGFVECTGTPEQGRSGGGLFTSNGEVIGVCVLADPKARRGLYAGLPAVRELLSRSGLSSLYSGRESIARAEPREPAAAASPVNSEEPEFASTATLATSGDAPLFETPPQLPSPLTSQRQDAESLEVATTNTTAATAFEPLNLQPVLPRPVAGNTGRPLFPGVPAAALRDTLAAIRGAEVVCIIRDRNNPAAGSRVIIVHEASDRFIADLTGELNNQIQPTSLFLPLPEPRSVADIETVRRVPPASVDAGVTLAVQRYRRRR